jgi:hypothetical protein
MLLLSSCSVLRVAYDNAEVFLRWQANSYFDFEGEQSEDLDRRIAAFLAWHRAHALPQYARLFEEAARRTAQGITRADLVWSYDSLRAQIQEGLRAAAGEMAGLLDRLSPGQIDYLERRLAEENRKFAKEQLQGTADERRRRRHRRTLERLEEWFGPLTEQQVAHVARYGERAPLAAELRDRDRRRRQAEFIAMLRAREARLRLPEWAAHWERGRDPAYAAALRGSESLYFDMLLDLDRLLTPAQREAVAARLRQYAAEFTALSRK